MAIDNVVSGELIASVWGNTVADAINELQDVDIVDIYAEIAYAQNTIDTHIADSSAAHAASAISFSPVGSISATDVQAAIVEVLTDANAETDAVFNYVQTVETDAIARELTFFVANTYTPTLTNIAIGTGGSAANIGRYTFTGGPSVGNKGLLDISVNNTPLGTFRAAIAASYVGVLLWDSVTDLVCQVLEASATYLRQSAISSTVPETWAAGSTIIWHATIPAVRV